LGSDERVGQDLPDLLSTTTGDCELGGPLHRLLACWRLDDREAAEVLLALRVRAVGDRPVGAHDDRFLEDCQPAAEHPHASVLGLVHHRVRSVGHGGQFLLGEGHRAIIERDQVPRHLTTPRLSTPASIIHSASNRNTRCLSRKQKERYPATTYSPTPLPGQYHRRWWA